MRETFPVVAKAFSRVGKIGSQQRDSGAIVGRIRFQLNSVKVAVHLRNERQNRTRVTITASKGDVWGAAGAAVTETLMEAVLQESGGQVFGSSNDQDALPALASAGGTPYTRRARKGAEEISVGVVKIIGGVIVLGLIVVGIFSVASSNSNKEEPHSSPSIFDTEDKSNKEYDTIAKNFVRTWARDPDSAVTELDQRAPESMRDAVRSIKLKRFDGKVEDADEGTLTVKTTGDQVDVVNIDATPIWLLADRYEPFPVCISIAKDSKKVISALPRGGGL